jgi:FkbM family methyltransferase
MRGLRAAWHEVQKLFGGSKRFGDFVFAVNDYGVYCIPASATYRPAAQLLMRGKVWEPETTRFLCDHAKGGTIITAGAFFGDALPALSGVAKVVYAFEPNTENHRCAHVTVLLNRLPNVKLFAAALGEKDGTARLVVKDHAGRPLGGLSQIAEISERGTSVEQVPMTTIDGLHLAEVALIHLDLEGYEEHALKGAAETLARCRPILMLETAPRLEGYRILRTMEQNSALSPVDGH